MAEMQKEKGRGRESIKHLWFGYGNYSGLPTMQVGGGYVRDPGLFERLAGKANSEHSPLMILTCALFLFLGLMAMFMLAARVVTRLWQ